MGLQAPIADCPYVVDFECRSARIVIEVDGVHHGEPEQATQDDQRTQWLEQRGYTVLRFWNDEVLQQTDVVVASIQQAALYGRLQRYPNER